jgi:tetratricopeptide (TPR) repeat protein
MSRRSVDQSFSARARELLRQQDMSIRVLAARTFYAKSYVHDLVSGKKMPTGAAAKRIDDALCAGGALVALVRPSPTKTVSSDELDALELLRRVEASDVSAETLTRLETVVDDLATAYATTPPEDLTPQIRQHLAYVARLIDTRMTLDQRRRLLVTGGWLSLLAATVHIDLQQSVAAAARLKTADRMADHAGHDEIRAWCQETLAWDVLTAGAYPQAVKLSQQAQAIAPRGSSAFIQATAQEGRAWARMGRRIETRDILDRIDRLVCSLPVPERPEHHYRYDPNKAISYTATTLAWVGDPAAEEYARAAIAKLESADDGVARPRRIASARLDLGLALLAAGKPDEAGAAALAAVESGRVVPSNWWRASEVLAGVAQAGIREAVELRDAYHAHRPRVES